MRKCSTTAALGQPGRERAPEAVDGHHPEPAGQRNHDDRRLVSDALFRQSGPVLPEQRARMQDIDTRSNCWFFGEVSDPPCPVGLPVQLARGRDPPALRERRSCNPREHASSPWPTAE